MPESEIDPSSRTTILVHYYRAMVGRADVWRMRMDTTAHWAIGATAAIISFCLSDPAVPHYVISIAFLMTTSFLLLEARRLTFYHLFQQRALILENELIRPSIAGRNDPTRTGASTDRLAHLLDAHLGRTVPTMPMTKAIARRLRRVYLYLFAVQLLAWMLKLANHPTPIRTLSGMVDRAHIGRLPGESVATLALTLAALAVVVAAVRGGIDRKRAERPPSKGDAPND